jgi:hypothetical protein
MNLVVNKNPKKEKEKNLTTILAGFLLLPC